MLIETPTPEVCPDVEPPEIETRSARAKRQFEEVWSNAIAAKQNWQRIAFLEALILLCAVCWIGYLGKLPKQVLYVVERDKAGEVSLRKLHERRNDPERLRFTRRCRITC